MCVRECVCVCVWVGGWVGATRDFDVDVAMYVCPPDFDIDVVIPQTWDTAMHGLVRVKPVSCG